MKSLQTVGLAVAMHVVLPNAGVAEEREVGGATSEWRWPRRGGSSAPRAAKPLKNGLSRGLFPCVRFAFSVRAKVPVRFGGGTVGGWRCAGLLAEEARKIGL